MTDNYILGGGISGLIAGFYLPDFAVITKPEKPKPFPLGPQYLYDVPANKKLLYDLGITTENRVVKVGYMLEGKLVEPTYAMLSEYHRTTRGVDPDPEWLRTHKSEFMVADTSPEELCNQLRKKATVIHDEIQAINFEKKVLKGVDENYHFDRLISTIPLPLFCKMSKTSGNSLIFNSVTFSLEPVYAQNMLVSGVEKFDYICILHGAPYRVLIWRPPWVVAEYLGVKNLQNVIVALYGKIVSGEAPNLSKFGVTFLGRFAEWKKNMKIHDVVEKVQLMRKEAKES